MATHFKSTFNSPAARKPGGGASGIGGILFAIVWICFSSVFVAIGGRFAWQSLTQSAWQKVPCVIDDFHILDDPNQDDPFSAGITYRYHAGGRERTGHHLYPATPHAAPTGRPAEAESPGDVAAPGEREDEYEKLARLQHQYLSATKPVCLVDPRDPDRAALMIKREDLWSSLAFGGFGLCFVGIGVGVLLQSIRQMRAGRGGLTDGSALTGKRRQGGEFPLVIGVPFFGLFAAAGCGMFCFISVPIVSNLFASSSWVTTPATVVWSRVASHSDSDGATYRADIFYRYTFDGKEYKSNRGGLSNVSSSGRSGKEAAVRANPQGQAIVCYVNPRQPWQAVRSRSLGWSALFGLFPLPFMAVGLGGLWYLVRRNSSTGPGALTRSASRRANNRLGLTGSDESDRSDKFAPDSGAGDSNECLRLTPGKGRVVRFLGMVFVTAFWNGIVSVFLWHVASEWRSGHAPWFLTLFLTPFVLIGTGLLLGAVHALGAIFNPRPQLTLEPGHPRLGQNLTVTWQLPGGAARLGNLRIVLRGEEIATYRRGTTTATDRAIFHEAVVFESDLPAMMALGRAAITLPDTLMPSWKADNNRIEWSLHIEGRIRLWPDLADSHVLTIHPAA
ncbi:MAG: DUF3592 domain-containing protein [Verrucomicrobia bacterium]|nr:DUF3592 domain-containing protein [Verrucomicrobiota bacterium]